MALIVMVSVVCCVLAFGVGWMQGGQFVAMSALVGMVSAAAGGLAAWAIVAMASGPNVPVTAAPMLGLMVRLVVTGAGVGLMVVVFGFEKRPALFAALFGYLVLMAMETILLYRFASSSRSDARPSTVESDRQD
ncbi:MAG: hypothetical protein AB8C95_04535 [Phycisphaeraceae bacterium]